MTYYFYLCVQNRTLISLFIFQVRITISPIHHMKVKHRYSTARIWFWIPNNYCKISRKGLDTLLSESISINRLMSMDQAYLFKIHLRSCNISALVSQYCKLGMLSWTLISKKWTPTLMLCQILSTMQILRKLRACEAAICLLSGKHFPEHSLTPTASEDRPSRSVVCYKRCQWTESHLYWSKCQSHPALMSRLLCTQVCQRINRPNCITDDKHEPLCLVTVHCRYFFDQMNTNAVLLCNEVKVLCYM